jgi:addiction module HigA family antidote
MTRTPIHPGEILADELEALGLSALALSKALHVPHNRISQILAGKRGISADTALRLSQLLGTTPMFWLNLQKSYELRCTEQERGESIRKIITPLAVTAE